MPESTPSSDKYPSAQQVEEAPQDPKKVLSHKQSTKHPSFKFKLNTEGRERPKDIGTSTARTGKQRTLENSNNDSIWRSSIYLPISQYQFRERVKEKEIQPKYKPKLAVYKKWQRERQMFNSNKLNQLA